MSWAMIIGGLVLMLGCAAVSLLITLSRAEYRQ